MRFTLGRLMAEIAPRRETPPCVRLLLGLLILEDANLLRLKPNCRHVRCAALAPSNKRIIMCQSYSSFPRLFDERYTIKPLDEQFSCPGNS